MKLFRATILTLAATTLLAHAVLADSQMQSIPSSQYMQPCSFWTYNTTINSYVCSTLGFSITVAELSDVQMVQAQVQQMQAKINDLEMRLRKLEQSQAD